MSKALLHSLQNTIECQDPSENQWTFAPATRVEPKSADKIVGYQIQNNAAAKHVKTPWLSNSNRLKSIPLLHMQLIHKIHTFVFWPCILT